MYARISIHVMQIICSHLQQNWKIVTSRAFRSHLLTRWQRLHLDDLRNQKHALIVWDFFTLNETFSYLLFVFPSWSFNNGK